ncbi:hypothetical protein Q4610_17135 [Sphingobium sp. HBC34]|uniref:Uncharacterized protein n=1 Tax=Sphingobium cyanobacteriorum TaxID=3063954 RepID=A0ABT8ZQE9_9SPHN|nr:hypothetical protein [Sphingobium sp. HBC34]
MHEATFTFRVDPGLEGPFARAARARDRNAIYDYGAARGPRSSATRSFRQRRRQC